MEELRKKHFSENTSLCANNEALKAIILHEDIWYRWYIICLMQEKGVRRIIRRTAQIGVVSECIVEIVEITSNYSSGAYQKVISW